MYLRGLSGLNLYGRSADWRSREKWILQLRSEGRIPTSLEWGQRGMVAPAPQTADRQQPAQWSLQSGGPKNTADHQEGGSGARE